MTFAPRLSLVPLLLCLSATAAGGSEVKIGYDKFKLANGLTVIVHEDRNVPIVQVGVWYNVGLRDEPAGKAEFSHLVEHLMFNGSENYDEDWFVAFEAIGATAVNGTTRLDRTNFF